MRLPLMFILSFPFPLSDAPLPKVELVRFEKHISTKPSLHKRMVYQKGMASWYGRENSVSSTGKRLNHRAPGLAHKTLPIGTMVKITSVRTNKTITAIVEDRGPYKKNRIVDLNYPAAKQLGILKDGVTKVEVELIH